MSSSSNHNAPDRPSGEPVPKSPGPTGADPAGPAHSPLPNERDEAGNTTDPTPSPKIEQAQKDVEHGLKDTSRGEASDAAYQKQK